MQKMLRFMNDADAIKAEALSSGALSDDIAVTKVIKQGRVNDEVNLKEFVIRLWQTIILGLPRGKHPQHMLAKKAPTPQRQAKTQGPLSPFVGRHPE